MSVHVPVCGFSNRGHPVLGFHKPKYPVLMLTPCPYADGATVADGSIDANLAVEYGSGFIKITVSGTEDQLIAGDFLMKKLYSGQQHDTVTLTCGGGFSGSAVAQGAPFVPGTHGNGEPVITDNFGLETEEGTPVSSNCTPPYYRYDYSFSCFSISWQSPGAWIRLEIVSATP